jgi:hypothetical protein
LIVSSSLFLSTKTNALLSGGGKPTAGLAGWANLSLFH